MHHPTDRITHTTAFVTPVVEHWLERDNSKMLAVYELLCIGCASPVGTCEAESSFFRTETDKDLHKKPHDRKTP